MHKRNLPRSKFFSVGVTTTGEVGQGMGCIFFSGSWGFTPSLAGLLLRALLALTFLKRIDPGGSESSGGSRGRPKKALGAGGGGGRARQGAKTFHGGESTKKSKGDSRSAAWQSAEPAFQAWVNEFLFTCLQESWALSLLCPCPTPRVL